MFEDPDFREEYRALEVKLYVTRTDKDPEHPTRPVISFFGEMQNPSTSTMTGRVKMTKDNQIQWHFVNYSLRMSSIAWLIKPQGIW